MFLALLRKEFLLEWRQRYALGGIVLYVVSTVFVVYVSFQTIKAPVWNALFWIINLFAAVNAVAKSFVQENGKRQLYYYTLAHPTALILSKIVYNTLLLFGLSVLAMATMQVFAGNYLVEPQVFWVAMTLGSLGFGIAFTFISAIAAKANNSGTLMAILSLPFILPILLLLIKLSQFALLNHIQHFPYQDFGLLLLLNVIMVALAIVLFPYLWRE